MIRAATRLASTSEWDLGTGLSEGDVFAELSQDNAIRLTVEDGLPKRNAPIPEPLSDTTHSARYERPFTMHGALAPSAAMGSRLARLDEGAQPAAPRRLAQRRDGVLG